MAGSYIEVTDQDFEEKVLQSSTPVVVDYWAPWCGPCRMMAPIFEELSTQYHEQMQFAKMNTDDHQNIPMSLGIRGIPTLIFFKDGREVSRIVGAIPLGRFKQEIESVLAGAKA
jgi:thioredoxin 1